MLYAEIINQTISGDNDIEWNYYHTPIDTANILHEKNSSAFINEYFQCGEKMLPFMINAETAHSFINRYFGYGQKASVLAFNYDNPIQLPDERAIHTTSGFFLGLLIEHCINGTQTLSIESPNRYPFSYLWFLTFLYHDYGYCVTERDNAPIQFPRNAPIPPESYDRTITLREYAAFSQIKRSLGIDLSPFSPYPFPASQHVGHPSIERALLREMTQKGNTIQGGQRLRFNNGRSVMKTRYKSTTITRYLNYCINELGHVDHGIVGGFLFYDRMLKNYIMAYLSKLEHSNTYVPLNDFIYHNRHFCSEQWKIFSYIADCILSHNIWKQPDNRRYLYERYRLEDLFIENFQTLSYDENPLLYILAVTDSIEPLKIYQQINPALSSQDITNAINIEFSSGVRALTFSSTSDLIDIGILYRKAKGLETWTNTRCSELQNGQFVLNF